ncbi:hypothetical protein, partial [Enterobacter hormaechei]|uniref:hypothetical protein n=3 Tax=Enterobacteriaceae TaxID=543 RepID=UPI002AB9EAD3|nr:hypothetical protein [Klebsiella pneumoniae]MDZ3816434.1 hypothetical protein [Klebsiella pneumoniae]
PQNDVTLKMPAFEWVHVQLHQQKGMISLSPPTICNSAVCGVPAIKAGRKAAQRTAAIQRLLLSEWRPLLDRHRTLRADLPESVRQRFVAGIQPSLNTRAV